MAIAYTGTPNPFAWSRHPIDFEVQSDDASDWGVIAFRFELWKVVAGGDEKIGEWDNIAADADKKSNFNFSQSLTDSLSYDMPTLAKLGSLSANVSCEYYIKSFEIIDGVENPQEYESVHRGTVLGRNDFMAGLRMYVDIPDKQYVWLTAKPNERKLYSAQEEMVSVLFTAAQAAPDLRVIVVYTDLTSENIGEVIGAVSKGDVWNFNLSDRLWDFTGTATTAGKTIARIEVYFEGLDGGSVIESTVPKLTYTFLAQETPYYRDYIYFCNYGGLETLPARWKCTCKLRTSGDKFTTDDYLVEEIANESIDEFQQSTGWIDKPEREPYKDFIDVRKAWYLAKEQQLMAIAINTGETIYDEDGTNIMGFTFNYSYGQGRQNFRLINAIEFTPQGGGGDMTPEEIRDALAGLLGNDRLDASAIKNLPAGGGGAMTATEIRDALLTLVGDDRLASTAIKNLLPVVPDPIDHNAAGGIILDFDTFNQQVININDDLDELIPTKGTEAEHYNVILKLGAGNPIVKWAMDWETELKGNAVALDLHAVLPDNNLYKCITAHNADAADYSNDIGNWKLVAEVAGGNALVFDTSSGKKHMLTFIVIDEPVADELVYLAIPTYGI